jgi:hypothetical protein
MLFADDSDVPRKHRPVRSTDGLGSIGAADQRIAPTLRLGKVQALSYGIT